MVEIILILTGKILNDMKRIAIYLGLATALVASCSIQEEDFKTPQQDDMIFYAFFEQPTEEGTRVYANEDLFLRWNADDRVSIFNKMTYNQQYKFLGETGDNGGGFNKVDNAEFITGYPLSHIISVYPYRTSTMVLENESVSVVLPSEQSYALNSFGLGANTMVSVSEDNYLQYKNVGGFLKISLYGAGAYISSITLKGNNGEKLAGKAAITMPLDGTPTTLMENDATTEVTLNCETPIALGASSAQSTDFWFVLPPVSFSKGFTIIARAPSGGMFEKTTTKSIDIIRSELTKMSPMEVNLVPVVAFADEYFKEYCVKNFDKDKDGEISYTEAAAVKKMQCYGMGIRSLEGIEHFTNLRELYCYSNKITAIALPNHKNIEYLWCENNRITSLDVHGCSSLLSLFGQENKLSFINVSGCTSLESLTLENNELTTVDVSECVSLTSFSCWYNAISNLDVSNCTKLRDFRCSANALTEIDVKSNTRLSVFECSNNQISHLDLTNCLDLSYLEISDCLLEEIDLSRNTDLTTFYCENNLFRSLDFSNNSLLEGADCKNNPNLKEIWLKTGQTIDSFFSYDSGVEIRYK